MTRTSQTQNVYRLRLTMVAVAGWVVLTAPASGQVSSVGVETRGNHGVTQVNNNTQPDLTSVLNAASKIESSGGSSTYTSNFAFSQASNASLYASVAAGAQASGFLGINVAGRSRSSANAGWSDSFTISHPDFNGFDTGYLQFGLHGGGGGFDLITPANTSLNQRVASSSLGFLGANLSPSTIGVFDFAGAALDDDGNGVFGGGRGAPPERSGHQIPFRFGTPIGLSMGVTIDANTVAFNNDVAPSRGSAYATFSAGLAWDGVLAVTTEEGATIFDVEIAGSNDPAASGLTIEASSGVDLWISHDPFAGALTGDYNGSGQVEQGDLDLVLQNWGLDTDTVGLPAGWVGGFPEGQVEQTELDGVLQNWGSTSAPDFGGGDVPEPAAFALLGLAYLGTRTRRNSP